MALTRNSIGPQSLPTDAKATDAAAEVYGQPGDATRMAREAGTAAVASEYTSTPTAESSYADGSFELGNATPTAHKQSGATISGQGSGFPGIKDAFTGE